MSRRGAEWRRRASLSRREIWRLIRQSEALSETLADVASDRATDKRLLDEMSRLSDENVIANVSLNRNTPSRVLERLLRYRSGVDGSDAETRIHVASNRGLRLSVVKRLAEADPSRDVREVALAAWALRLSPSAAVSPSDLQAIYRRLGRGSRVRKALREAARAALAKHPRFPGRVT